VADIVELAERLGKAIAESPEAARVRAARQALGAEPGTAQMLKDYNAHVMKIAQLEQAQKPIEPEDKHKLDDLHNKLIASEAFKKLTAAQVEYAETMRKVNEAIRSQLAGTET